MRTIIVVDCSLVELDFNVVAPQYDSSSSVPRSWAPDTGGFIMVRGKREPNMGCGRRGFNMGHRNRRLVGGCEKRRFNMGRGKRGWATRTATATISTEVTSPSATPTSVPTATVTTAPPTSTATTLTSTSAAAVTTSSTTSTIERVGHNRDVRGLRRHTKTSASFVFPRIGLAGAGGTSDRIFSSHERFLPSP